MKKIWLALHREEHNWLLVLMAVILLSSLLELSGLVLVIPYVDIMLNAQKMAEYTAKHPILEPLLTFAGDYRIGASILFGGFYLLKNFLLSVLSFVQLTIIKKIKVNLMNRMYRKYIRDAYAFHLRARSSELVRSITYDALMFSDGVLVKLGVILAEMLLLLGVLAVLIIQSPAAMILMLVMIVPLAVINKFIKGRLAHWGRILQQREATLIQHMQESLGGIKDVIISHTGPFFERKFYDNVEHRAHVRRNRDVVMLVPRYIIETLMMATLAGALVWLHFIGGLQAHFSMIAFLAMVTVRLMPMSNRVFTSINNILACKPSIDVVYENARPTDGDEAVAAVESPAPEKPAAPFQRLEVKGLSFSYFGHDPIIKRLDCSIERSESIGVVGGSGAGKTTLIDLLLGLLVPIGGTILQNGEDIHDDLRQWHAHIGYVQQSVFLLDAPITENIAFGIPRGKIDIARVQEIIRLVNLEEWVDSLPEGVESVVGERGVRISGGQRQRIGIARALFHDPDILVLDEATSALDNLTEKMIIDDIYNMRGDRTLIMIAHRLDTIRRCDRILVLDQGRIVGDGSYDELLANNKTFQSISLQARHTDSIVGAEQ